MRTLPGTTAFLIAVTAAIDKQAARSRNDSQRRTSNVA